MGRGAREQDKADFAAQKRSDLPIKTAKIRYFEVSHHGRDRQQSQQRGGISTRQKNK